MLQERGYAVTDLTDCAVVAAMCPRARYPPSAAGEESEDGRPKRCDGARLSEYYRIWMDIAQNIPQLIKTQQLRSVVQTPDRNVTEFHSNSFPTVLGLRHNNAPQGAPGLASRPAGVGTAAPEDTDFRKPSLSPSRWCPASCVSGHPDVTPTASCPTGDSRTPQGDAGTRRAVETCDEASVLSGLAEITAWRDNPLLPDGLVYEGVSEEPVFLSGCSAAQSSAIQCFDAFLGVQHEEPSGKLHESQSAFLRRIRLHMPPDHRRLIESLSAGARLRDLVISARRCTSTGLQPDLRNFHLCAVAKFITVPSGQARAAAAATAGRCPLGGGLGLDSTGTGDPTHDLPQERGEGTQTTVSGKFWSTRSLRLHGRARDLQILLEFCTLLAHNLQVFLEACTLLAYDPQVFPATSAREHV
ncbi:hypothetical protein CRUP_030809 [Coryphaenoides rupestris]|nr:hypothetical protein CRUP_030809 [Coryphaenoides rupestris]